MTVNDATTKITEKSVTLETKPEVLKRFDDGQ